MISKKYLNISEVSKLLQIEEYKIRYWDSIDPKTKKLRFEGLSTKTRAGTRYFNKENLKNLKKIKDLLYDNGNHNYSTKLANDIISKNNRNRNSNSSDFYNENIDLKKLENINQILNKMRFLLK